jgi:hypothetical protein
MDLQQADIDEETTAQSVTDMIDCNTDNDSHPVIKKYFTKRLRRPTFQQAKVSITILVMKFSSCTPKSQQVLSD